jgi:hypothetical protein
MTYNEVLDHFGTQVKLAAALNITQPTISAWNKVVPMRWQYQIEVITDGHLKADRDQVAA